MIVDKYSYVVDRIDLEIATDADEAQRNKFNDEIAKYIADDWTVVDVVLDDEEVYVDLEKRRTLTTDKSVV